MLSDRERQTLIRIARETLCSTLTRDPAPDVKVDSEALQCPCGCFVTLKNRGRLRGCIGMFSSKAPLYQTVRQMAGAALRDPRFLDHPVTAAELAGIRIEISVLTPLEQMKDPMNEIELGRHGICIDGPLGSGCFLPQVATETGWSKEEFLSHCAAGKAGLPPDAWTWPEVIVYRFEAEVFGEEETEDV